jgi:hypothetical protein
MTADPDLFPRALAAADIAAIAGVKLFRAGKRLRGPCPLCGASQTKKSGGAFSVDPQAKLWKCWACGEGGDAVDLEHALHGRPGESLRDTAMRLAEDRPAQRGPRRTAIQPLSERPLSGRAAHRASEEAWKARAAAQLWRDAAPAAGSPVETYLRARGVCGRPLELALRQLRFAAEAYHSGPGKAAVRLPAMVGLVRAPAGPTGGVHVTYLAPDGSAKTARTPAKRMWGPQSREGAPGGVWLTHPEAQGPLVVAEGIESALSAAVLLGRPCRAVAALALERLQGGWRTDKWGRVDPDCIGADPERPAFTWPEPAASPWGEVLICVDRDMSPVTVKARKAGGGTWRRPIDGDERARICGALAEQAWRRAGARAARTLAPGAGRDFNDELRARLSEGRIPA